MAITKKPIKRLSRKKMQEYIAQHKNQIKTSIEKHNQQLATSQMSKKKPKEFKFMQPTLKNIENFKSKSVICIFFKQGSCQKGEQCIFSHNLPLQEKIYAKFNNDKKKEKNSAARKENADFCCSMMETYGLDFEAMARDHHNIWQLSSNQIRRKIVTFINEKQLYVGH